MEAKASGTALGACSSVLEPAQEGSAVAVRAQELCALELGPGLDHVRQVLAAEEVSAAGDRLLAAGKRGVSAAAGGPEVVGLEEGGRTGDLGAESQRRDDEEPEVRHGADVVSQQWEDEQRPQYELVSAEQFVEEGQGLLQMVQLWAEDESLGSGGKVWLDLHVGRQEEVLAEEPLVEGEENQAPPGPEAAAEGHQEQSIRGHLVAGEELVVEGAAHRLEGQGAQKAELESQAETREQGLGSGRWEPDRPGPGGPCSWSPLEAIQALQALQAEMEPLNEQARRAFSRLQRNTWQRRKPHLELRSSIIQQMPGFWVEAHAACRLLDLQQFVHHPELSAMISVQDKTMLSFMIDLKVEKGRDRCKIVLLFGSNPYFHNDAVVKEYLITLTGPRACYSTPIQWHKQYQREACRRRHNNTSLNFFNWFSDHSLAGCGRIAEYIYNDLWSNPVKYYVRKNVAAVEGTEKRTGTG